jgi:hypothetical protein
MIGNHEGIERLYSRRLRGRFMQVETVPRPLDVVVLSGLVNNCTLV